MNNFEQALQAFYTPEQFSRIQQTNIGIAGAGGLGSNIALALVRSGFRNFEVLDKDVVEWSNLNRQQFIQTDVSTPKVTALEKKLRDINPDITFIPHYQDFTQRNSELFKNCDILFEAFDKPRLKKELLEAYSGSINLIIAGNGMTSLHTDRQLLIKRISPHLVIVGDNISSLENKDKPYAPRVMACAALMAAVALESVCQK